MDIVELVAECKHRLNTDGLSVEMASDMRHARELILESRLQEDAGTKPYLTDFLNPDQFTYTSANCFWIFLRNASGQIAATVAFRMDTLRNTSLRNLHDEILRSKYPEDSALDIDPRRLPPIANRLTGNIAFAAELWMDRKHAGAQRQNTVYFAALSLATTMLEWPDLDLVYGFVRKRDALLGAVQRYGFPHAYPGCLSYSSPISAPPGDLYFVYAYHDDLVDMILSKSPVPSLKPGETDLRLVHTG